MFERTDTHRGRAVLAIGAALAIGVLAVSLTGCTGSEYCVHRDTKYYDEALSQQLTKNNVKHSVVAEKGVCVARDGKRVIERASQQVDTYFHQVATLAGNSCEERALVAWATRERLRFDVLDSTSSTGRPGRMFLIRSFSTREAE